MGINSRQLEEIIIRPTLAAIGLLSDDAVYLLLGTAAQETGMGTYLAQTVLSLGRGGLGVFQMEAIPYSEIWNSYIESSKAMRAKVLLCTGYSGKPPATRMCSDLVLATIMARLFYARIPAPLPPHGDIQAMGEYYKKYFNTYMGKATVEEFIANYKRYVLSV